VREKVFFVPFFFHLFFSAAMMKLTADDATKSSKICRMPHKMVNRNKSESGNAPNKKAQGGLLQGWILSG
jgi:hypothetical protein